MVGPNAQADECDRQRRAYHDRVTENGLARKDGDNFRGEGKGGNNQDIDFRMTENPEKMHPKCCGTASLRVEEMRAGEPVKQEHDLGGREWTDRDQHHPAHDEVKPSQEWHFRQRHATATHAQDRGDDVRGSGDRTKAADHDAQNPIIGTVPF